MTVTTFAAIDIGSYEVCMKIFELSRKNGFRELNHVRYRLEIGKGAYSSGRLEQGMVDAICERFPKYDAGVWRNGISRLFHKRFS